MIFKGPRFCLSKLHIADNLPHQCNGRSEEEFHLFHTQSYRFCNNATKAINCPITLLHWWLLFRYLIEIIGVYRSSNISYFFHPMLILFLTFWHLPFYLKLGLKHKFKKEMPMAFGDNFPAGFIDPDGSNANPYVQVLIQTGQAISKALRAHQQFKKHATNVQLVEPLYRFAKSKF